MKIFDFCTLISISDPDLEEIAKSKTSQTAPLLGMVLKAKGS